MEAFEINVDSPRKRQNILVVQTGEYLGLKNNNDIIKNGKLMVLPIRYHKEFNENFVLLGGMDISPGTLLIQSPLNDKEYFEISVARNLITVNVVSSIIRLSSLLGAKKIEIESIKILDKNTKQELIFNVKADEIKGNLQTKKSMMNYIKDRVQLSAQFENGHTDADAALKFLKTRNLDKVSYITDFYEMRISKNPLKEYKLSISTTENMEKSFSVSAGLSFLTDFLQADFNSIINEKIEILLNIEVKF